MQVSLNPDGVPMSIDWDKFGIGASVYIPCINTVKASKQVKHLTSKLDMRVQITTRSENGKWGIRVWRIM